MMGTLIMYGLLAAAFAFGGYKIWTGFTGSYIAEGKQIQLKADQPIIDAAKAREKQADEEANNARTDTAKCAATAKLQSEAVTEANKRASAAQAETRAILAAAKKEAAAKETRILGLQSLAAAPPQKDMACEVELAKAKAILQETLRARRGIPTPAAPTPVAPK